MNDPITKALARKARELFRANQDLHKRVEALEKQLADMSKAAESFRARTERMNPT
jgi:hypothetical protein